MPRDLRYVPPGSLVEVTCRTIQGRYLLRPSPELNEIFYGVLGRALDHWQVGIVHFHCMSNHLHMLLLPKDAEDLARFMGFVEGNLSKEVGRLHDWSGSMWADRYHSTVVSDEPEAQVARLKYVLGQGVKEGLVRRPEEWPGPTSTPQLLHGGKVRGKWFDRTAEYEHRRELRRKGEPEGIARTAFADDKEYPLASLPCWRGLTPLEHQRHAAMLAQECEAEGRRLREKAGRPVMGAKKLLRVDPHDRPERFLPSPRPRFHAIEPALRAGLEEMYRKFVDDYRTAAHDILTSGKATFPAHCFPPPRPFWRGRTQDRARGPDP